MTQDVQKQAFLYLTLRQQGMDPAKAFQQAFPDGVPSALDRAKDAAAAQQKAGYGQIGGLLAGALGTKTVYDMVTGKPILGGAISKLGDKVSGLFSSGAPAATEAATTAGAGVGEVGALGSAGTAGEAGAGALAPGAGVGTLGYLGGGLGVGLGGYEAYQGIKKGNPLTAGLGGAGIGLGLNSLGLALGPVGWGAAIGVPLLAALGGKLFHHETTKEHEGKVWGDLAGSSDPQTAAYAHQYQDYLSSPQAAADAERAKSGTGGAWKPEDVWGGSGMFNTFGSDWLNKYSADQRRQISQQMLNQNLIHSVRGELEVSDPNAAHQIADSIVHPLALQAAQQQGPATKYDVMLAKQNAQQNAALGQQLIGALGRQ